MNANNNKRVQQFFNKAVNGLARQGWRQGSAVPSQYNGYHCQLRGADGTKCFVGQLLTNAQAKRAHEDVYKARHLLSKSEYVREFLCRGQELHDGALSREDMHDRMRSLANQYDLKLPKCLREVES